jgi:sugar lactone lactonase YvrE
MRWPLLLAALMGLAGCGELDRQAMVLTVEEGWAVEVAEITHDGAADGLHWRDGRLFVADEGASAVRTLGGRILAGRSAGLMSPEDLALDREGNLLFSDDSRGGVWRTDSTGRTAALAAPAALPSTEGLAVDPSGHVLVGDPPRRRVMRIAPDGRASVFLSGIAKAESFAFDDRGSLYIADNEEDVLYLRTANGTLHRSVARTKGFSPESLHFQDGTLFVTDSRHGKLFRYTPEDGLHVVALFGGRLANVQGVTGDGSGGLYVSVQSDLKAPQGYILHLYRRRPAA